MIRHRLVAGLVTATALVTLAACGSDAKSSTTTASPTTSTAAATTTAVTATSTAAAAATTSTPGTATTDAAGTAATAATVSDDTVGGGDDTTGDSLVGNCVKYADEFGKITIGSDLPDQATVNTFFNELSGDVPADLRDDVATLKGALTTLYSAIAAAGGDLTEAAQNVQVQQAIAAMDEEQITVAGDAVQKWFDAGCPG